MSCPKASEYNSAIQNPQNCFRDAELRQGQAAGDPTLGLPLPWAGNFSVVYRVTCPGEQTWAVKCFTREVPDLRRRYRAISEHLQTHSLPCAVEFRYLDEGILVGQEWYPILKMRWVEGVTFNAFVKKYADKPAVLARLADLWLRLADQLRQANLAHGDLQVGNLLLVSEKEGGLKLRLIDYDGMWVPAADRFPPGEVGHPDYQHPARLQKGGYSADVDRFSQLVIYTALRCLMAGGSALWKKYDNDDNMLFTKADFATPSKSKLFAELLRSSDEQGRALAGRLLLACHGPLDKAPFLPEAAPGGTVARLTPEEMERAECIMAGMPSTWDAAVMAPTWLREAVVSPYFATPKQAATPKTIKPVVPRATKIKDQDRARGQSSGRETALPATKQARGLLVALGAVVALGLVSIAFGLALGGARAEPAPGVANAPEQPKKEEKAADLRPDVEALGRLQTDKQREMYLKDRSAQIGVWRRAAEQGLADGQWLLGQCLLLGVAATKNDPEAAEWCTRAAQQGHALAQNTLGLVFAQGVGVKKDDSQATHWFRKAADQGNAMAQYHLGEMYEFGRGVSKDEAQAAGWYRKAAQRGHLRAQTSLAWMCAGGNGVKQDDKEAVTWFRKAAEQGDAPAQNNLGSMFAQGRGVKQDDGEAVRWYSRSAEQGNADGQASLATMYANGWGVEKDDAQAARWFRKAAEQGNATAQYHLGLMCELGRGVVRDEKAAVRWYLLAAEQSNALAQTNLGWRYANGRGVKKDEHEAVRWYRKAADQGHPPAQAGLGWLYEFGQGVSKDVKEAICWYRKAAEQGDANAQASLTRLEKVKG